MTNKFIEKIQVRFSEEQIKAIDRVVKKNRLLFPTRSLFIRASVLKNLREYQNETIKRKSKKRLLQNIKYE